MIPARYWFASGVVNSRLRYWRRVSSVDSMPTALKRFVIVGVLSSAARIPLPGAVSFAMVDMSSSWLFMGAPSMLAARPCWTDGDHNGAPFRPARASPAFVKFAKRRFRPATSMSSRRNLMEWLVVAVVLALGVPAAAWFAQERMIFLPQPGAATAPLPAHAAPLTITAPDGTVLRGWIARGTAKPAPAILYFGGNAEEVSWTLSDARWPREWTIVALNYRGYGAS